MNKTKIEWCDRTWNPVTGCTPVSEGCSNCYAARMSKRLAGRGGYPKEEPFRPATIHHDQLIKPMRMRQTALIFVCSMGDLFHDAVSDEIIARIIGMMRASNHVFILLTKRPARMKSFFQSCRDSGDHLGWITHNGNAPAAYGGNGIIVGSPNSWPLPNLWLGVTAETQARANERIPILLQTPAAVRFVSIEPMLGPMNLVPYLIPSSKLRGIEWVICGGETGPGARPLHPNWTRSLRDQCIEADVPYFFKGWGAWLPMASADEASHYPNSKIIDNGIRWVCVGKKRSGNTLDGQQWHQLPLTRPV